MEKKVIIICILVIVAILVGLGVYKLCTSNNSNNNTNVNTTSDNTTVSEPKNKKLETVASDNGFRAYALSNINITNPNANLIVVDDIDTASDNDKELTVSQGYEFNFTKLSLDYTFKVLELTDDYITVSINGLAPTKESGGFSLLDHYDKIKIKKNTGVELNMQMTDVHDGSLFLFYVGK